MIVKMPHLKSNPICFVRNCRSDVDCLKSCLEERFLAGGVGAIDFRAGDFEFSPNYPIAEMVEDFCNIMIPFMEACINFSAFLMRREKNVNSMKESLADVILQKACLDPQEFTEHKNPCV